MRKLDKFKQQQWALKEQNDQKERELEIEGPF